MTLILLLPASGHDKHDTHIKTKYTTHAAPGDMSTTTHHSSRSTAAPMSSLPLPPHFCSAIDRRCSSFEVCNPICCCGLGSCCTFLPALHPSLSNPYHPPPAHQHHYSWLDCLMLLVVVFLPRVIRHHSPQMHKKNPMPPLSTT